ncbi:MFS transporter [Pectobacterium brasiliense]|uniref:Major facilitator transporter n=1 Tax=Pectobacterium brasiliense TaxID=180957 RepID=A0A0M2F050_9GAMM|nr:MULTISPECIES: MFS transporter [Pectobacterium]KGA33992.1 major facilitator transporter [Pectobacterium brasiliense]MCG5047978.1 MFS transporter [Pectobacterium brasiliense]OYN49713.1 MFS transporter [Pectobacterium carotovorum]
MPLRSLQALCLLSFFMADVRDGLGPFLGIFLTQQHWAPGEIGFIMTLGGVAGLLATIPAGLITDSSHHKRQMLLFGCVMITSATLLLWFNQSPWVTGISQIINGIAAAFIGPILTGLTLGLTGQNGFKQQMGKNEAFNHAGNMAAATIAGISVWYWGIGSIFILMTAMAFLSALAIMGIRENDINHKAARGIDSNVTRKPISWSSLLINHSSLMTIGVTLLLFHLGNAALLPMLSIRVASEPSSVNPGLYAAATVIISQAVMIPVALWTAGRAERLSYRQLIMIALLILPIRAALAATFSSPYSVIPVQILDGVSAGILGVAVPGYIVKELQGSGHINAGQSIVMFMQGVGATASPALTGIMVGMYSYSTAFSALGAVALLALLIWWQTNRSIDSSVTR